MTGPKRNGEFCFHETLNVEGKQNSLFPVGPVSKCFVIPIPANSKLEKDCEEIVCFTPAGSQISSGFKEHDLITCESKVHVVVSLGT